MKYLPFENIIYRTKLDSNEIIFRLRNNIEPYRMLRLASLFKNKAHKDYQGDIDGWKFDIIRIINYRNPFLPRIKGKLVESPNGMTVNLKMRLHPIVLIFLLFWSGIPSYIFVSVLVSSIESATFDLEILFLLIFPLAGYGLTTAGFKYESNKSIKYFSKLFDTEIKK